MINNKSNNLPVIEDDLMDLIVGETGKQYFDQIQFFSLLINKHDPVEIDSIPDKKITPFFAALWYFYYEQFIDYINELPNKNSDKDIWAYFKLLMRVLREIGMKKYIPPIQQELPQYTSDILPIKVLNLDQVIFDLNMICYFINQIPEEKYRVRQQAMEDFYSQVLGETKRFIRYPDDILEQDFKLDNNGSLFWYTAKLMVCAPDFLVVGNQNHLWYVYKLTRLFEIALSKDLKHISLDLGQLICGEMIKLGIKNNKPFDMPIQITPKIIHSIRYELAYSMGKRMAQEGKLLHTN
ncbi:MAG: hypothetical protein HeimC2_38210 [Candidatus Heimdallarchaeota archaeon LC_2]|nr:MAG: hypothetical protein HeimC2_38210 [Candidatus Heimdallarchaeota archaeon LC_2]